MLNPPIQPMLLKSTNDQPFNSKNYLFEFKWDGFRCIIFIDKDKIHIQSRNQNDLTSFFPELHKLHLLTAGQHLVLDGEICYFTDNEKTDFYILQKRLRSQKSKIQEKYPVTFITWDLLELNDKQIFNKPIQKRKKILKNTIEKENSLLQISPYKKYKGKKLYEIAKSKKLEGIVAKKLNTSYKFKRSNKWKKIKIWQYTSSYIGGYKKDKTALLVGKKTNKNKLKYRGKVKISLNQREKEALLKFLPSIKKHLSPFNEKIGNNIIWVKPVIKCQIKFTELTPKKHYRHGHAKKLLI